ncbi:hypothetical protein AAHZ94_31870 [Streptomyces sp. HSW2009]|uniref:hypothetical protein n=1 Tax=Streptomyces sp. HSW2009 TaxID=3142890 RepID=UPI0032EDD875
MAAEGVASGPPGGAAAGTAAGGAAAVAEAASTGQQAKERRLALSAGLGRRNRPKWLSCSLVLSVAGALAIGTSAVFLVDNLHGGGDHDRSAGAKQESQPPASGGARPSPDASDSPGDTEPTGPGTGQSAGTVPKNLIGTWTGTIYAKGKYNGQHTATIRQGRRGEVIVQAVVDLVGMRCYAVGTLVSVTERNTRLTVTERPDPDKGDGPLCTGETAQATYTWDEDKKKLVYKSEDTAGGRPVARLTRQE